MQVKAQGLLNAVKWIQAEYGQAALERILQSASLEVQERCRSAIAISWHPAAELIELLELAERELGTGDGKVAERIGAAGARANMKGVLVRMAFWVAKPEFLMKRVAGLWRQFNSEGQMLMLHVDDATRRFEVTGIAAPNWLFCCTITGWGKVSTEAAGVPNPVAKHVTCRGRGHARCVWEVNSPPPRLSLVPPSFRR